MPIVDVTLVTGRQEEIVVGLTQTLADGIGRALASPPAQTWVRLHVLAQDRYAENEAIVSAGDLPVFVVVLARAVPDRVRLAVDVTSVSAAVAEATGRPAARVHVEFAPPAAGRIAFGGRIVE